MSEAAGAEVKRGVFARGGRFSYRNFTFGAIDYYSNDIMNIFYTEGSHKLRVMDRDIRVPGMGGFKLQEDLLKSQTRIPVIFITSHDSYQMEDEAMRLEAIAYFRKPFDEQNLLDAVQLACEKGI